MVFTNTSPLQILMYNRVYLWKLPFEGVILIFLAICTTFFFFFLDRRLHLSPKHLCFLSSEFIIPISRRLYLTHSFVTIRSVFQGPRLKPFFFFLSNRYDYIIHELLLFWYNLYKVCRRVKKLNHSWQVASLRSQHSAKSVVKMFPKFANHH